MSKSIDLAARMREHQEISLSEKLLIVAKLSLPAILAMISEIVMQYIDSAMVGSLGAEASASIGLVASSTWLIGGLINASAYAFSVQVAHAIGAGDAEHARSVFRQSLIVTFLISSGLLAIAFAISFHLPEWLGADPSIWADASAYFRIYALFLPVRELYFLCQSMLQCSGDMKTPSFLSILLCASDVVFNYFLIFPSLTICGITVPGAGLGVAGAAYGTAFSYVFAGILMVIAAVFHSPVLSLKHHKGSWKLQKPVLKEAAAIAIPMGMEQAALSAAQVFSTRIVAPLGTISIAANSFAVTAESFCYMPGYGIGSAATTLVGQALGADRKDLAKSFAWLTTFSGIALMTCSGLLMYDLCPYVFSFLTPVKEVQELGARVLRIELHAEPLFAASIVATGALRGAGDTAVPGILNLVSIWGVRITLASILSKSLGLPGVWYAMATELCFRGVLFLIRLYRGKWLKRIDSGKEPQA